jgi:hypothetical protein
VQSDEGYVPVFFTPRGLKNLVLVDEMPSLMPLTDMKVANLLNEEIPQIYATTGRCVCWGGGCPGGWGVEGVGGGGGVGCRGGGGVGGGGGGGCCCSG